MRAAKISERWDSAKMIILGNNTHNTLLIIACLEFMTFDGLYLVGHDGRTTPILILLSYSLTTIYGNLRGTKISRFLQILFYP